MSFFKKIYNKSKKNVKFSASDPSTFEEVWSFTSSRIRVTSLILVVLILFSVLILYVFGGVFSASGGKEDVSIERSELEDQRRTVEKLLAAVEKRDRYIAASQMILSGKVPVNSNIDSLQKTIKVDYSDFDINPTKEDQEISKKVKNDMRTVRESAAVIPYFKSPVNGVVSQKFEKNHSGIDVVTEKDHTVKACLAGTVIYSGYTRKDGYILIVDHGNDYMSVYKHNKKALKKMGAKVKLGDAIAIVGNTGENTDGPHLHFELWYKQVPVNPEDYLKFKR